MKVAAMDCSKRSDADTPHDEARSKPRFTSLLNERQMSFSPLQVPPGDVRPVMIRFNQEAGNVQHALNIRAVLEVIHNTPPGRCIYI